MPSFCYIGVDALSAILGVISPGVDALALMPSPPYWALFHLALVPSFRHIGLISLGIDACFLPYWHYFTTCLCSLSDVLAIFH
jgi:hypothetical protein